MVRQFRIQGIDTGVSYSLNDFNKYLLTLPQGLGFEFKNTFIKVGNQRVLVDKEYQFKEINGTIEVSGNTRLEWEENYNELRSFIAKNRKSGFKLYYKTTNEQEKYIICNIRLLTKTEKTSYCLLIPIALEPRSLWEKNYTIVSEKDNILEVGQEENLMAFLQQEDNSYSYSFKEESNGEYSVSYITGFAGNIELVNDGDEEIPLKIILKSECETPILTLKNISGESIESARIFTSLYDGDVLTLNSNPENLSITVVRKSGVVEDVTSHIDMSRKTFLTLPIGNYVLEVTDVNGSYVQSIVEINKRYLGG